MQCAVADCLESMSATTAGEFEPQLSYDRLAAYCLNSNLHKNRLFYAYISIGIKHVRTGYICLY